MAMSNQEFDAMMTRWLARCHKFHSPIFGDVSGGILLICGLVLALAIVGLLRARREPDPAWRCFAVGSLGLWAVGSGGSLILTVIPYLWLGLLVVAVVALAILYYAFCAGIGGLMLIGKWFR
jgi:peptidoglycan/LPS O-acetylase OafA/YrhL